ncbi:MAG: acyl-CoA dehydrogenase [Betaproteobacteria bacterium]|nr:acyl-CoA dehydrogenase [Betaproteobacteria bacterium]
MHDSTGSWELPEELKMLRETVRRFMEQEVKPIEDTLPHDAYTPEPAQLASLQKKARDLGLWCFETPAEHGGAGLNLLGQCVVAEETSKCRMGAYIAGCGAFGFDPPNVIWKGSEYQIREYGHRNVQSGDKAFVAISESSGGSDPARAIATRAERKGDRYILNGTKIWISGAGQANWGIAFAKTGEDRGRNAITSFIIRKDRPGIKLQPIPVIRSYFPYEVHLENYEAPMEDRLGEEGQGFALAEDWLVHGRVPYAAATIGIAQASLELAKDWARQRKTFGSHLADKQAIQWMIADSEVELRAARLLVYQAAWNADLGRDIKIDASVAKLYGTEVSGRVVDRCIQIFGGLGVAQEMPLERWYREMRIKRIGEGPSEVHRMVIARDALGSRRNQG